MDLIYGLSRDCGRSPCLAILYFSCPMGIVLWLGVEKWPTMHYMDCSLVEGNIKWLTMHITWIVLWLRVISSDWPCIIWIVRLWLRVISRYVPCIIRIVLWLRMISSDLPCIIWIALWLRVISSDVPWIIWIVLWLRVISSDLPCIVGIVLWLRAVSRCTGIFNRQLGVRQFVHPLVVSAQGPVNHLYKVSKHEDGSKGKHLVMGISCSEYLFWTELIFRLLVMIEGVRYSKVRCGFSKSV